jgi:homoserine kinase type II
VATFTRLSSADLTELAGRFGLGVVTRTAAIAAGTINSNFEVDTTSGRYFVRVNEGKTEDDVAWEAELVGALADRNVPAPEPLAPAGAARRYLHWRDKYISVFRWCDGAHLAPWQVDPSAARQVGRALAALHLAGLAIPPERRRPSRYAFAALGERLVRIADARDPLLDDVVATLADEHAILVAAAADRDAAAHGVIHGDLFRDNVLWSVGDPSHRPAITALLDFEQASAGSFAYDVAVCVNDWCWSGGPRLDLATALIAGYHETRPLADADRRALPIEIRAAAARFTITRLTDVYLAGVHNPDKDYRDFYNRLVVWRQPGTLDVLELP